MPDAYGNLTEAELRNRGQVAPVYNGDTPIQTDGFTYTNGRKYPGTKGQRMSDQALATWGNTPIASERDVLGGGQFGMRNWLHDNPGTVVALAPLLAWGGSLLAGGGAAAGGAGAGAGGAGTTGTGLIGAGSTGTGLVGAGGAGSTGLVGAGSAGAAAMPEILVTGTAPAAGGGMALAGGAGALGGAAAAEGGGGNGFNWQKFARMGGGGNRQQQQQQQPTGLKIWTDPTLRYVPEDKLASQELVRALKQYKQGYV